LVAHQKACEAVGVDAEIRVGKSGPFTDLRTGDDVSVEMISKRGRRKRCTGRG
jgi:hypothetical protein